LAHFIETHTREKRSLPMHIVMKFAMFSSRRQEEITRITWEDSHEADMIQLVRDMKHPGQKKGNDVRCETPPRPCAQCGCNLTERAKYSHTTQARSAASLPSHVSSSISIICTFTIFAMRQFPGFSRWAGQSRKPQPFLGIAAGNPCSDPSIFGKLATNMRAGMGGSVWKNGKWDYT
jgi:hypothetical protein